MARLPEDKHIKGILNMSIIAPTHRFIDLLVLPLSNHNVYYMYDISCQIYRMFHKLVNLILFLLNFLIIILLENE